MATTSGFPFCKDLPICKICSGLIGVGITGTSMDTSMPAGIFPRADRSRPRPSGRTGRTRCSGRKPAMVFDLTRGTEQRALRTLNNGASRFRHSTTKRFSFVPLFVGSFDRTEMRAPGRAGVPILLFASHPRFESSGKNLVRWARRLAAASTISASGTDGFIEPPRQQGSCAALSSALPASHAKFGMAWSPRTRYPKERREAS